MKKLIMIGRGGHALSCLDVILSTKQFDIIGFVDAPGTSPESWKGLPFLGTDLDLPKLQETCSSFFLGIGQIQNPELRKRLVEELTRLGANFPIIVSPNSYVSPDAQIGEGTIVMHGSHIGPGTKIGSFNIINTKSLLEHGCSTGNFVHVSTAAVVNGDVSVGSESFIGSNSVICHGIQIPSGSFVQAGQFVGRKHVW